jgi:hypothetical protein
MGLSLGLFLSTLLIAFTAEGVVGKSWNETLEAASIPTYGMILLCAILSWAVLKQGNETKDSASTH